jgi:hypothetical protein
MGYLTFDCTANFEIVHNLITHTQPMINHSSLSPLTYCYDSHWIKAITCKKPVEI